MKKLLILTAVGAILATPAVAVYKCVALDFDASALEGGYFTAALWYATFPNYTINGVSRCASNTGTQGDTLTSISTSGTAKYCWCKTTNPLGSKWAYLFEAYDAEECADYCHSECGTRMTDSDDYRRAILSTISD